MQASGQPDACFSVCAARVLRRKDGPVGRMMYAHDIFGGYCMQIQEGAEFDIIVAGAGCAGFCAAVQAGRAGLRVALFEHFAMPGGSLTVLGSNSIDQFNNPHRPAGDRMIISGIGW